MKKEVPNYDLSACRALMASVVLQAMEDYRIAKKTIKELEKIPADELTYQQMYKMSIERGEIRMLLRFFRSDRLAIYTDIPGEEIIALLRTRDLNKSFLSLKNYGIDKENMKKAREDYKARNGGKKNRGKADKKIQPKGIGNGDECRKSQTKNSTYVSVIRQGGGRYP